MSVSLTGKVVEIYDEGSDRIGIVDFHGRRRPVYLNLVPEAAIGNKVRFHAGFATDLVSTDETLEESFVSQMIPAEPVAPHLQGPYRILSELDSRQLRKLLPLVEEKFFGSGAVIFHSGEKSKYLHLIVAGDILLEEDTVAQPVQITILRTGDALGWSALTSDATTHFQARALSGVATLAFPGAPLRALCEQDNELGYALTKRLLELVTGRLDAVRLRLAGLH